MPGDKTAKWRCTVCGHLHDGDFAEGYKCPICGRAKDYFAKID